VKAPLEIRPLLLLRLSSNGMTKVRLDVDDNSGVKPITRASETSSPLSFISARPSANEKRVSDPHYPKHVIALTLQGTNSAIITPLQLLLVPRSNEELLNQ